MMDVSEIVRAIDVARVEGRALVLMKVPPGVLSSKQADGSVVEVPCVTVARSLCAEIERKLPGVAAVPVPVGFDVSLVPLGCDHAGGRHEAGCPRLVAELASALGSGEETEREGRA